NVKSHLKYRFKNESGKEKEVPYPGSALDYHILYDTSGIDLERIRGHLRVDADEATHLYARPYLITPKANLEKFKDNDWLKHRRWENLKARVEAMRKKDPQNPNRHLLPNSMLHDLREGLFMGKEAAEARMRLVRRRYQDKGFDSLLEIADRDEGSLFRDEAVKENGKTRKIQITGFLDALDVVEFWRDENDGQ
ncbi:MAG: hypothetical protein ACRD8U_09500, partial [Pyrinomonadaceae bacterium]